MKQRYLKVTFSALSLSVALLTSGQAMAATITSTTTGGAWDAGATWMGGTVPGASDDADIQGNISAPTGAGPFSVNSIIFSDPSGDLDMTGKSLTVLTTLTAYNPVTIGAGGTITVLGNTLIQYSGAEINMTGGTLVIGANLDSFSTPGSPPVATLITGTGTLKLTDANHTIALDAAKTFAVVDASSLTGATGAGKTITFADTFSHTISSLTLPAAAATAKEIKFVVPASQSLTISAITGNTMTCTGTTVSGTAAAPILTAGGSPTTFTCTTATASTTASSPIKASVNLSLGESGEVTITTEEITIK